MSSLTEHKKALTFALVALGVVAAASAMFTPHVAFADGGHHHHHHDDCRDDGHHHHHDDCRDDCDHHDDRCCDDDCCDD